MADDQVAEIDVRALEHITGAAFARSKLRDMAINLAASAKKTLEDVNSGHGGLSGPDLHREQADGAAYLKRAAEASWLKRGIGHVLGWH